MPTVGPSTLAHIPAGNRQSRAPSLVQNVLPDAWIHHGAQEQERVGADRAGIRFLVAFGRKSPQCLPTAAAVGARGAGSRAVIS